MSNVIDLTGSCGCSKVSGSFFNIIANIDATGSLPLNRREGDTYIVSVAGNLGAVNGEESLLVGDILVFTNNLGDLDSTNPVNWTNITNNAPSVSGASYTVHGSSQSSAATDSYLRGGGNAFMNLSPFIVPFNATIIAISASTEVPETWTAEVHSGLSLIAGASLSISAATSSTSTGLSINVNAGDPIELYVNGTNIQRPSIAIFLIER